MKWFTVKMAWRETRRAWRHFLYFLVCIAVGVGALVGITLFGAHVEGAVTKEARGLLGGDVELRLSRPISPGGQAKLAALGERGFIVTHVSELVGMAARAEPSAGQGRPTQIIELKAVESAYPLYGTVKAEPPLPLERLLAPVPCPVSAGVRRAEICHGVLVQESLLIRMQLAVGATLHIGHGTFVITGVLRTEPDRMANAFSLGPRVLMSQAGLRAADLVRHGSRIRERYLVRLPTKRPVEPLVYELREQFAGEGARVSGYRDAQPQLKQSLEQLTRYLGLIGLTALFVGGLGVATSVHAFIREKMSTIAMLKTLGSDSPAIIRTYLAQALLLGGAGSVMGLVVGLALQQVLPWVVARWLDSDLLAQVSFTGNLTAGASALPLVKGLALGLLSTVLFALWPLLTIREISPAVIVRREVAPEPGMAAHGSHPVRWRMLLADPIRAAAALVIAGGLVLLSIWQAGSWKVGLLFVGAFLAAVLLLATAGWSFILLLKRAPRPQSLALRQAVGNLIRPGSQAVNITVAIGIGVMVVATVSLVEGALLTQVGENRPTDAPTFFFIDIQPDQTAEFARLLAERARAPHTELTPLVRARVSAVKGVAVQAEATTEEADQRERDKALDKEERRKKWYVTREYVLTFLERLPKDNEVIKGAWWSAGQTSPRPLVSIEEEAARALQVDLGDVIEFDIQGVSLAAEVSSIRKVEWGNFSTNFYMILSPGSLDEAPITYVATVRADQAEEVTLQQAVVAAFPNVTAINIGDILGSFAAVLDRLALAIRAVAGFCVLSGALVMAAALAATRYRRLYESVILKAIGATRATVARSFAAEYALLGCVGGLVGTGLASALSWTLLTWMFDLPWSLQPRLLGAAVGATVVLTVVVGFFSTFRILGQPPLAVLRHE